MLVWSDLNQAIELWQITTDSYYDKLDNRVVWYVEFPAFTFGKEIDLKKMVSAELWLDSLVGEAIIKVEWRPDGYVCWIPWTEFKLCTGAPPVPTPEYPQGNNRQSYRQTITLPTPPMDCTSPMNRPSNQGMQMQCRITVKGYLRIRGLFLHAEPMERKLYDSMITC